jgi:hypothetical protein
MLSFNCNIRFWFLITGAGRMVYSPPPVKLRYWNSAWYSCFFSSQGGLSEDRAGVRYLRGNQRGVQSSWSERFLPRRPIKRCWKATLRYNGPAGDNDKGRRKINPHRMYYDSLDMRYGIQHRFSSPYWNWYLGGLDENPYEGFCAQYNWLRRGSHRFNSPGLLGLTVPPQRQKGKNNGVGSAEWRLIRDKTLKDAGS